MNKRQIFTTLIIVIIISSAMLIFSIENLYEQDSKNTVKNKITIKPEGEKIIRAKVPAIDAEGNGLLLDLEVELEEGTGKVFTDIENLIFWLDTQNSIKTAKKVAEEYSYRDSSNLDLAYTLKSEKNTSAVGGSSGGAIITLATIAILNEKELNDSIITTGNINDNGTIGSVGGLEEKVKIAEEYGAKLFLLPESQKVQKVFRPIKNCETTDSLEVCTIKYEKIEINPFEKYDIKIKEISNIGEAMRYYKL